MELQTPTAVTLDMRSLQHLHVRPTDTVWQVEPGMEQPAPAEVRT